MLRDLLDDLSVSVHHIAIIHLNYEPPSPASPRAAFTRNTPFALK
jgi:hypothetical protein